MANIHTSIICKNIAPLVDLKYNISSSSLKFAIFANNGSGKTFISRLFRLLENDEALLIDGAGNNITDAYLTYGKTTGEFSLNISDDISCRENLRINLEQGTKPIIPTSNYIYHTFNQDYVDKNIRADYIGYLFIKLSKGRKALIIVTIPLLMYAISLFFSETSFVWRRIALAFVIPDALRFRKALAFERILC